METNLRQANTRADVVGVVAEKKLEIVNEDGKNKIKGYVTVKTSDVNFVRFNVNVNEKTKTGKDNKTYAGIQTVMNEYKSIAEAGEDATKVRVSGNINPFTNQNGEKSIMYNGNFFNRVKNEDDFEPKSEFSVEMYISGINPEFDAEGCTTGRVIVEGWLPTYNGIEPLELVAEQQIGQAIESSFEVNQTVEFYGEIINNRVETITEIPVKIGKPRKKITTNIKNELLITGASEPYEKGITQELPYETDVIRAAIQERANKIKEAKAKTNNTSKPSGAAHGRSLGF